jgi:hypothetical protein
MKQWNQKLSGLERDAELAILVALTNLPAGHPLANSQGVPEAAVACLRESVDSGVTTDEPRRQVMAAVGRLQADGFVDAPSDPKKCWRLTHNGSRK